MNIKNIDKYCFIWSTLASVHPCDADHPNRVSKTEGFDFSNGFRCSEVQKLDKPNKLSINIFELIFYRDKNKWKHNLIPVEISKKESDKVFDLLIYKNHYALIRKLNVSSGDHIKSFICRRCVNSYTSENMLMIDKLK